MAEFQLPSNFQRPSGRWFHPYWRFWREIFVCLGGMHRSAPIRRRPVLRSQYDNEYRRGPHPFREEREKDGTA